MLWTVLVSLFALIGFLAVATYFIPFLIAGGSSVFLVLSPGS